MFTAQIIFVSITLFLLIGITFYLKVPKASIPLLFIYLIFIIKNQSFDKSNEVEFGYQDLTNSKKEVVLENESNVDSYLKKNEVTKLIEPKPLTFDSQPNEIEKNEVAKKEIKSE